MHELAPTIALLIQLSALATDDWQQALEQILRIDSVTLGVERASYWSIRKDPPRILCELGYTAGMGEFERGAELFEQECPTYFREILKSVILSVEDARSDSRTNELRAYLTEWGIASLMDVPVHVGGAVVGILCHEHVASPRAWTEAEQAFAAAVSQCVATTLEARRRTRAEAAERQAVFLAEARASLDETLELDRIAGMAVRRAVPTLGDLAYLVVLEGDSLRYVSHAHVTPEGDAILDKLARHFHDGMHPEMGFLARALRSKQSLLIPMGLEEYAAGQYPTDAVHLLAALRTQSAMAVPLDLSDGLRGVMAFGAASRTYDQGELRFAEVYGRHVANALSLGRLYQQVQDALHARDDFLSLASHELRTPLASLRLLAEALVRQLGSNSLQVGSKWSQASAQRGEALIRQVDRLDRLADRLLHVAQGSIALRPPQRSAIDLSTLTREVVQELAGVLDAAGSSVVLDAGAPVIADLDRTYVEQIMTNLLDNAIKFGAGKPIEVTVQTRSDRAVLAIRDHGAGIAPEKIHDIFARYERGVSPRQFGGLGLGLYVVWQAVHALGGTIDVQSNPGEGATFVIDLPLLTLPRVAPIEPQPP